LGSHPFTADPVKITVTNFKGSAVFATKLSRHLLGSIHIEVENTSNNFRHVRTAALLSLGGVKNRPMCLGWIRIMKYIRRRAEERS
jgi:hypothetical protein